MDNEACANPSRIQSRGFTLIELLIVVLIIAILAAIAVPNFLEFQTRSKVSRAVSDMRSIATAVEAYMVVRTVSNQVKKPGQSSLEQRIHLIRIPAKNSLPSRWL